MGPEIVAGVTLLAIAVPEQLATAQLADVPAFLAILAFVAASLVFATLGSNPILSVGADSTIAPLFAVALVRLAAPHSPHFLILASATAVATGVLIMIVGLFRLGWIADFLSVPIVAGFMAGIGVTIIVHQLPHAMGLVGVDGSLIHRLTTMSSHLGAVHGWTVVLALGTLLVMVIGERLQPRLPFALLAVIAATFITGLLHLTFHGVSTLGHVAIVGPQWRLSSFSWGELATVAATAATVAIVVLSQSAATSRSVADEMGVRVNLNKDFVAIGAANILTGALGTIPVNASPARTSVVRIAGGTSCLVGLVAAGGALLVIPMAPLLRNLPLAALAGVLFYVAGRLIKFATFRAIARVDPYELALSLVTSAAVIFVGVQVGLAVAVILAVLDQTRRSARPRSTQLGRRPGSTSWEPLGRDGAVPVDAVTVLLFAAPLYFVNAGVFRTEVHDALQSQPDVRHLVLDAAAITDIDFTGLTTLGTIVDELHKERIDLVIARPSDLVSHTLSLSPNPKLKKLRMYSTVDEAVKAVGSPLP